MNWENISKYETVVCLGTLIFVSWYYVHRKWKYFEEIGVPFVKPTLSKLGSLTSVARENFTFEASRKAELGPVYGYYSLTTPNISVHDPDILRQIYVKEFHNFPVRMPFFNKSNGKVLNEALSVVTDESKWKRCRSSITPIFSTAKLKQMHGILNNCADRMVCELNDVTEGGCKPFPVKTIFGNFSLDVVLSAAFDTQLQDKHSKGESGAAKQAKKIFDIKLFSNPLPLLLILFPKLEYITSRLGFIIWPKDSLDYFEQLSKAIMKRREEKPHETNRVDIMQLMIDLQIAEENVKNIHSGKGLTRTEIVANAMLMIVAGYENTANTLGFLAYNLAMNPEIQTRLQEEIDDCVGDNGDISYSSLHDMKYLDMCLNETLRLYSPVLRNARVCANETTINGVKFKKDTFVNIPIFALHRDPEYWENPEEFNPERMSDMSKIDPMVFQPFGAGPRNCIAQRFAKNEVKLAMAKILLKYNILPSESTQKPPLNLIFKFAVNPVEPIYLKIQNRN